MECRECLRLRYIQCGEGDHDYDDDDNEEIYTLFFGSYQWSPSSLLHMNIGIGTTNKVDVLVTL